MFDADRTDWAGFREVNRLFAEAAAEEAKDDAVIWIHDYNLWLVPTYLRKLRPKAKIAFFHHTPFPAPDIFNILPWREEIIDSLLTCDLVSFHIPRYARNFVDTARSLRNIQQEKSEPTLKMLLPPNGALSEPVTYTSFRHGDRTVHIDSFPIGTNPPVIREVVRSEEGQQRVRGILEKMEGQKLIVSIGRVDYVKGTRQMLEAFERLLQRRPELIGKTKLLVTSVPATEGMKVYRSAQSQIEQIVGRINGRFRTFNWYPIVLFTQSTPFEEVVTYYRAADICWTTPLRDGLNLVAKEFVAAHEGTGGVLILSEFTGVAAELHEAVLTNPYSRRSMDSAIDQAIDMPQAEQERRMHRLCEQVNRCDMNYWAQHMMRQFERIGDSALEEGHVPAPCVS
jgi:glucosylglycerol-phosphate synthase